MHVKKGDKVIVIAGKDKGKTGVIARALPSISKVVIDGINVAKKAIKKTRSGAGKMVEVSMPIHSSNVKLVEKTAKADKKPAAKKVATKKVTK
ncbi:MAG: ribosomal protein [Candidatus Parcubacteria bacterium]|jgi:large subunit ribosomal protein L24